MPSTARPSVWIARTRAGRPPGSTVTWSPVATEPSVSVPVTTVPLPLAAKTRSIHNLGRPRSADAGVLRARPAKARRQLVEPVPRRRRDGDDRRAGEERAGEALGDLHRRQLDELGVVEQVDLGEGDDAVGDADELEDAQVLLALRLPALGGGDDEEAGVDAADAGEHVAQEAHVAGDVDEADRLAVDDAVGEAEVDRQAAPLLLLEAVGVGAGQQAHERRLAVVDVTGGGDHPHGVTPNRARARRRRRRRPLARPHGGRGR